MFGDLPRFVWNSDEKAGSATKRYFGTIPKRSDVSEDGNFRSVQLSRRLLKKPPASQKGLAKIERFITSPKNYRGSGFEARAGAAYHVRQQSDCFIWKLRMGTE